MPNSRQEKPFSWSASSAGLVLGTAAVRTASRPCHGIWHDARFYVVQALHNLHPQRYSNDLLFRYGSQDSFSLFSPVLAASIQWLGLNAGAIAMLLAGQLASEAAPPHQSAHGASGAGRGLKRPRP